MADTLLPLSRKKTKKTCARSASCAESGIGIAEALISGAIGTALIAALLASMNSTMRSVSKADTSMELLAIKAKVTTGVDCSMTLPRPCVHDAAIPLLTGSRRELVSAGGTRFGKFLVLARCVNTPSLQGIDVRAAVLTAAGMSNPDALRFNASDKSWFLADEMNRNLPYSWSHPKSSLTGSTPAAPNLLCSAGAVGGTVPPGRIIMWSGSPASIPPGWALCDGSAPGRPDLRDRFVIGAGGAYAASSTGGNSAVSIGISQMPSHTHHTAFDNKGYLEDTSRDAETVMVPGWNKNDLTARGLGWHSTRVANFGTVTAVGGGAPLDIRPPYYALAYIIKLP